MSARFPRSLAEAFPHERFCAVEVYRRPLLHRVWRGLGWCCTFGLLAAIGVLLAFRG